MAPIAIEEPTAIPAATALKAHGQKQQDYYPDGLKKWTAPTETKEQLQWAELETIDLTLLDDPSAREDLIKRTKHGLREDGFLFVTGTGVSSETIQRNLAIAQHAINLEREEKEKYAAKLQEGSYEGYKLRGIWTKEGGVPDNIEVNYTPIFSLSLFVSHVSHSLTVMLQHFNLESTSFANPDKHVPPSLRPYLSEIQSFAEHTYHHIVYRILKLVSLALDLPEDYLWELHEHSGAIGHACQRYMGYFPRNASDDAATAGIWSKGHTDCKLMKVNEDRGFTSKAPEADAVL